MSLTKQDLHDIRDVIFEAFEVMIDPRLERLETGVAKLEAGQARLEGRQAKLEAGQASIEGRLTRLESGQAETNVRLSAIESRLDDMDGRLIALEADIKELYEIIGKQQTSKLDANYKNLTDESKLHFLQNELQILARHLNVEL